MDKVKVENFLSAGGAVFPSCITLDEDEAKKKILFLVDIFELSEGDLVDAIDRKGEVVCNSCAMDIGFSFRDLVVAKRMIIPEDIYINWYRFDVVDKMSFDDFNLYFDDIWYPGVDDIDVFSDDKGWIFSISHYGQIKFLSI